jgi:hypothetical protein
MQVLFTDQDKLVFEVTTENDKIYKIMNKIFREGFLLTHLNIKSPTLDDIFIKIARQK